MLRSPKTPTTLTQALALADDTLTAAYHLKLDTVLNGTFATITERAPHLAELGGILAAGADLEAITPALALLRKQCRKVKPTTRHYNDVLDLLDVEAAPLTAITCDVLSNLPYLAAVAAEDRAAHQYRPDETFPKRDRDLHHRPLTMAEKNEEIAAARERAAAAKTLLEELPAILTRIRELAEAGDDLTPATAWLK